MLTPVGFNWMKLIWNPLPVGQPEEGPSTVVESLEVRTFSFKVVLMVGYDCYRERSEWHYLRQGCVRN